MLQLTHPQAALFNRPTHSLLCDERNPPGLVRSGSMPEKTPHELLKSFPEPTRHLKDQHKVSRDSCQDRFKEHETAPAGQKACPPPSEPRHHFLQHQLPVCSPESPVHQWNSQIANREGTNWSGQDPRAAVHLLR